MTTRRKKKTTDFFSGLDEACKDYGAMLLVNESWLDIIFKDGRYVTYALPFDNKLKLNKSSFKDMIEAITSGFQGRVFSKDGSFIGYVPRSTSIAEMLVKADMML